MWDSNFNGFAGPRGTRRKVQGIKERISFLFLPCPLYPVPSAFSSSLGGRSKPRPGFFTGLCWRWLVHDGKNTDPNVAHYREVHGAKKANSG